MVGRMEGERGESTREVRGIGLVGGNIRQLASFNLDTIAGYSLHSLLRPKKWWTRRKVPFVDFADLECSFICVFNRFLSAWTCVFINHVFFTSIRLQGEIHFKLQKLPCHCIPYHLVPSSSGAQRMEGDATTSLAGRKVSAIHPMQISAPSSSGNHSQT